MVLPRGLEPGRQASFDRLVRYNAVRISDAQVRVDADDTTGPFNKSRLFNRAAAR